MLTGFLFKVISVIQLGFINDSNWTITILGLISELLLSTSEFSKDIVSIFLAIEFAFTAIEF